MINAQTIRNEWRACSATLWLPVQQRRFLRALALFSLSPLILAYLLRDFSRALSPAMRGPFSYLAPFVVLDIVMTAVLDMPAPREIALIAGVNLTGGAVLAWYRWQSMCKAPAAFPAGRIAG